MKREDLNFTKVSVLDMQDVEQDIESLDEEARKDHFWIKITNTRYNFSLALMILEKEKPANWEAAKAWAAAAADGGRLGDRICWITIYNAIHTAGLNELIEKLGGDPIRAVPYWTEDADEDPRAWSKDEKGQSYAANAWFFYGTLGYLYNHNLRIYAYAARVLRALPSGHSNP
ncbi:MAG: hypothetical protein IKX53_00120 [Bacteroidales bacterium]|nr:hypothetical protein [Bacteroidales bacterium]